ncbi:ABC transporter permease [Salinisphaera sp. T31B1]|uniref:ABC transporter permease n=1 Tax=Salinisphaera sp. T31B1 TaxID=727963 RepID=UPI003341B7EC
MANNTSATGTPAPIEPPVRAEFERQPRPVGEIGEIARDLSLWQRVRDNTLVRNLFILLVLAGIWQLYTVWANNPLLFPTFTATISALWDSAVHGPLLSRAWNSISVLLVGYGAGVALATVMTTFAVLTRFGSDLLGILTAMFSPLPAIALLPLALLWFGLGTGSIVFVLIHAVLWAVALNMLSGFISVSETLRMAGRNYGLTGWRYVTKLLMPAAFPTILSGLKIGWMFAWRTQIAAELVFGANSSGGGIGWFIFENRNELQTDAVFAGLLTVILIGLLVEGLIFRTIEVNTVRKWGMQR